MRNALIYLLAAYMGSAAYFLLGSVAVLIAGSSPMSHLPFKLMCQAMAHVVLFGPLNALLIMGVFRFQRNPSALYGIPGALVGMALIIMLLVRSTRLFLLFYLLYAFPAFLIALAISPRLKRLLS